MKINEYDKLGLQGLLDMKFNYVGCNCNYGSWAYAKRTKDGEKHEFYCNNGFLKWLKNGEEYSIEELLK